MNLAQFIETYPDAITQAVLSARGGYSPVYTARNQRRVGI
jgi:hypothetical protein